jgi:DNA-binding NarL/FixJ family response regulator
VSAGQLWRGHLTPREAEVVELISQGYGNKAIANELGVTYHAIKFHLRNAKSKLGLDSRWQLARWWWENVEDPVQLPRGWEGSE